MFGPITSSNNHKRRSCSQIHVRTDAPERTHGCACRRRLVRRQRDVWCMASSRIGHLLREALKHICRHNESEAEDTCACMIKTGRTAVLGEEVRVHGPLVRQEPLPFKFTPDKASALISLALRLPRIFQIHPIRVRHYQVMLPTSMQKYNVADRAPDCRAELPLHLSKIVLDCWELCLTKWPFGSTIGCLCLDRQDGGTA